MSGRGRRGVDQWLCLATLVTAVWLGTGNSIRARQSSRGPPGFFPTWRRRFNDNANMSTCAMGWQKLAAADDDDFSYCVRVFLNLRMTWVQAEETCAQYNDAHLLSFDHDQQVEIVQILIDEELRKNEQTWPGYTFRRRHNRYRNPQSFWTGLGQLCPNMDTSKPPNLKWSDKNAYLPDTQEFWKNNTLGQSSTADWQQPHCVSMSTMDPLDERSRVGRSRRYREPAVDEQSAESTFSLKRCDQQLPFVCKAKALRQLLGSDSDVLIQQQRVDDQPSDQDDNDSDQDNPCGRDPFWCPLEETLNGRKQMNCYRLITTKEYWDEAETQCSNVYNGQLTSIHNNRQMHFINNMTAIQPFLTGEQSLWIGLHRRNSDRTYQWTDGSGNDFLSAVMVEEGEEETEEDGGNCVVLRVTGRENLLKSTSMRLQLMDRLRWRRIGLVSDDRDQDDVEWMNERCDSKLPSVCRKFGFGTDISRPARPTFASDPTKKCAQGWTQFRNKCYRVFGAENEEERKIFQEAMNACTDGGRPNHYLVSITDAYEQGFVLSLLRGKEVDGWLGLNVTEGRMRWIDDVPLHFTRFSPTNRIIHVGNDKFLFQNHNNFGFSQEACVYIDGTTQPGYWNLVFKNLKISPALQRNLTASSTKNVRLQETCEKKKLPYICEKYPDVEVTKTEISFGNPRFEDVCEQYDSHPTTMTSFCFIRTSFNSSVTLNPTHITEGKWEQVKSICEGFRLLTSQNFNKQFKFGNLPSVADIYEWSYLTAKAKELGYTHFWLGLKFTDRTFEWIDNWPMKIGAWGDGEPDVTRGRCVAAEIGQDRPSWVVRDCDQLLPFVCKLTNAEAPARVKTYEPAICPSDKLGWIQGRTRCYFLVSNASQITTGYRADHDCFRLHRSANLASFPTSDDFDAFTSYVHTQQLTIPYAYIGLVQQQAGSYAWSDHSTVQFVNWAVGQPEHVRNTNAQECVQMELKGNYSWYDVSCWQSRHFLCSVPALPALPQQESTTESTSSTTTTTTTSVVKTTQMEEQSRGHTDGTTREEEKEGGTQTTEPPEVETMTVTVQHKQDNKEKENLSHAFHKPPSAGGSSTLIIVGAVLTGVFMLALLAGVVYFGQSRTSLSLRGLWSSREPRIMQFDSLQNEDDFGI